MKKIIKETLNERVFVELFAEIDENGKVYYFVSALFRFSHKSRTEKYKKYEMAKTTYEILIK